MTLTALAGVTRRFRSLTGFERYGDITPIITRESPCGVGLPRESAHNSGKFVSRGVGGVQSVAFGIEEFVMRERIAFLLIVLSLSVYACAQEGTVEHGWTDKNNAEMYAAYMLQNAYNEQGYWGARVEIRQAGTKRVFVVQQGRIYHVERFDVSGLSDLPEEAMTDSPKTGDVYSPDQVEEM